MSQIQTLSIDQVDPAPAIDVIVEASGWPDAGQLQALVKSATQAIFTSVECTILPDSELSIVFSDDTRVRDLNDRYRGKEGATNVLSFPGDSTHDDAFGPMIGDVILALETVANEAGTSGQPLTHHMTHLVIHGILHLLGYDHQTPPEAEIMEQLETRLLEQLGIADPYPEDPA